MARPRAAHEYVMDGVTALVAGLRTRAVLSRQVAGAFALHVPVPRSPLH